MIQFAIFILSILTGFLTGNYIRYCDKVRISLLSNLKQTILHSEIYINYNNYERDEILSKISENNPLFPYIIDADGYTIKNIRFLDSKEKSLFTEYTDILGSTYSEGQNSLLHSLMLRIENRENELREEQARKGNLYCTLGILCGAAFGIIAM